MTNRYDPRQALCNYINSHYVSPINVQMSTDEIVQYLNRRTREMVKDSEGTEAGTEQRISGYIAGVEINIDLFSASGFLKMRGLQLTIEHEVYVTEPYQEDEK